MHHPLVGLWTLLSWHRVFPDSRQSPYCESPIGGFLVYTGEGLMAVSIYEREQTRVLTSYAGRFEYQQGEVVHHPIEGSSPYGIQDKKVRLVRFEHEQMIMETKESDPNNIGFIHRLIWQKRP